MNLFPFRMRPGVRVVLLLLILFSVSETRPKGSESCFFASETDCQLELENCIRRMEEEGGCWDDCSGCGNVSDPGSGSIPGFGSDCEDNMMKNCTMQDINCKTVKIQGKQVKNIVSISKFYIPCKPQWIVEEKKINIKFSILLTFIRSTEYGWKISF